MDAVHFYDYKWNSIYESIKKKLTLQIDFEICLSEINNKNNNTIKVSNLLLNDRKNNYDEKNNISVEELISYTWPLVKNTDFENLFFEQYLDIMNGTCSQGRTTRIFQILHLLIDSN